MKQHPSPLGHGWELVGGHCRPVRHRRPALPMNLPTPGPAEQGEDYEHKEDEGQDDGVQTSRADSSESSGSDSDEAEWSDSN